MTSFDDDRLHLGIAPAEPGAVEIVERKGLGHPDSICDALAETASLALCRLYRERCGLILHHNVDKVLLWAGETDPVFGGGRVIRPIEIFVAGRATRRFDGAELPVEEVVTEACRAWLCAHLRHLDARRHVKLHILLRSSSDSLVQLFPRQRNADVIVANDTSCGVGFAPLSQLERSVLAVEHYLNAAATKATCPEIGEDIKVMGVRRDGRTWLTVAAAFVAAHVADTEDYLVKKKRIREMAEAFVSSILGSGVSLGLNVADRMPDSLYLTVTGLSAESGDDGEAGRGNRANGLITPYRPMTMESLAGKNPVNHVGKLYNLAAGLIANDLVERIEAVEAAEVYLVSQIGHPIGEPQIVDVRLRMAAGASQANFRDKIIEVITADLGLLGNLADDLLAGRLGFDRWPLRRLTEGAVA